ncbi:MAG: hypothetical protein ACRDDY_06145 [Clostridium sp.]|uniref:hypothetical protein n=1 Tax=Clostridium sp. TaxID=1506 RepID=UPI003EE5AE0D
MIDNLGIGILIYLDDILVKSINSIQGNSYGYIDIKTRRKIWDVGLTSREHKQNQNTCYLEDRENKDKREGFKGYNKSDVKTETSLELCDRTNEQRGGTRCEEQITEIYTAYVYHMDFCNNLIASGNLKKYCNGNSCKSGDYVFLKGTLIENTTLSYIESILLVIDGYGEKVLDPLIPEDALLKTKNIKIILEKMKQNMEKDGLMDLIIQNEQDEYILQVNGKNFFNSNCCRSSNIGCMVNIVGKLIKKSASSEHISLLRKLDQTVFYENLLLKIKNIFDNINIGIEIPVLEKIRIENTIQIIPISIFI